jgi:hypothetical protein
LSDEKSERLGYFAHATVFERLHEVAQSSDYISHESETLWSGLLSKDSAFDGVWKGMADDEEKKNIFAMLKMWTGWTGAMHNEASLKWWGFEQEYVGNDLVVQPGYQKLVEWNIDEIKKAGGDIRLSQEITELAWKQEGECYCIQIKILEADDSIHSQRTKSKCPRHPQSTLLIISSLHSH